MRLLQSVEKEGKISIQTRKGKLLLSQTKPKKYSQIRQDLFAFFGFLFPQPSSLLRIFLMEPFLFRVGIRNPFSRLLLFFFFP